MKSQNLRSAIIMSMFAMLFIQCVSKNVLSKADYNKPYRSKGDTRETEVKMLNSKTFLLTDTTSDLTYGYTQANPINVGGGQSSGVANEYRYLRALLGPKYEPITYQRLGSCCMFDTKNSAFGKGLLDKYEIKVKGKTKPIILYINLYDAGDLFIPVGFKAKR